MAWTLEKVRSYVEQLVPSGEVEVSVGGRPVRIQVIVRTDDSMLIIGDRVRNALKRAGLNTSVSVVKHR